MNEQLQQALAAILQKANNGIDAGVSFLSSEIPDVIHQLLLWKMAESIATTIFGAIMFYAAYRSFLVTKNVIVREMQKPWLDRGEGQMIMLSIGTGILALIGFGATSNIYTAMQIIIAPKIYLLEYAANLAK